MDVTEPPEQRERAWWRRLRATALLALLLTALGVSVAAVVGLLSLALAALLDQALG